MTITLSLPLRTVNPTNAREYHRVRSTRAKIERRNTWVAWLEHRTRVGDGEHATITLTRVGPKPLDDDAVPPTLKAIRDALAALLIRGEIPARNRVGQDDSDPRLTWRYEQAVGKYEVRVSIEVSSPAQDFKAMTEEMTWKGER